jgi:hypothetical protein
MKTDMFRIGIQHHSSYGILHEHPQRKTSMIEHASWNFHPLYLYDFQPLHCRVKKKLIENFPVRAVKFVSALTSIDRSDIARLVGLSAS